MRATVKRIECGGGGGDDRRDMKGEKMTAPCMACHWPVSLLIELFSLVSPFLRLFLLSALRRRATTAAPSAILAHPFSLVIGWARFEKASSRGGLLSLSCPEWWPQSNSLPPIAFPSCVVWSFWVLAFLFVHMHSSSVSALLYLSPLRLYAGKA